MTSARRLNIADIAKGIAILIVVFYHLSAPGIINNVCTHLIPAALLLFFFFSGKYRCQGKGTDDTVFQIFTAVLVCRNHLSFCDRGNTVSGNTVLPAEFLRRLYLEPHDTGLVPVGILFTRQTVYVSGRLLVSAGIVFLQYHILSDCRCRAEFKDKDAAGSRGTACGNGNHASVCG